MTRIGPAIADHWAVSTRSDGAVQTVETSLPGIQLGVLGVPQGFTADEIRNWLRDLAGVALETSRTDPRPRPIPQVLHHALTGLLFSQSELWSKTGQPVPLSAVFMDDPNGLAFGWVGQARIRLRVNGLPHEPRWVLVRDEAGHQAVSTRLPADAHVSVELEYRPHGEDGTPTSTWLRAEWGTAREPEVASAAVEPVNLEVAPAPEVVTSSPIVPDTAVAPPALTLPDTLPTEQPGLAQASDRPSTFHPSASTFVMPRVPSLEGPEVAPTAPTEAAAPPVLDVTPSAPVAPEVVAEPPMSEPPVLDVVVPAEPIVAVSIEPVPEVAPSLAAPALVEPTLPPPALWTPAGVAAPVSPPAEAPVSAAPLDEPIVAEAAIAPEYVAPLELELPSVVDEPTPETTSEPSATSDVIETTSTEVANASSEVASDTPTEPGVEDVAQRAEADPSIASPTIATPSTPSPATTSTAAEPSEPRHPVAKWLSRVLGRSTKSETPEPAVADASTPADEEAPEAASLTAEMNESPALGIETTAPTPEVPSTIEAEAVTLSTTIEPEATPIAEPVAVTPEGGAPEAAPLSSYDALLSSEADASSDTTVVAEPTTSNASPSRPVNFGLAPVSLADVMRRRAPVAPAPSTPPSAPSPVTPVSASPGPSRLSVEREPVGADPSFGIPRVPQREPARPVAAPRPEPLPWRAVAPPAPIPPTPTVEPVHDVVEVTPVLPEPPLELLAALEQAATVADALETPVNDETVDVAVNEPVVEDVTTPTSTSVTESIEATTEPVVEDVVEPVVEPVAIVEEEPVSLVAHEPSVEVVEPEPVVDAVSVVESTVEVPTEAPTPELEPITEASEVATSQVDGEPTVATVVVEGTPAVEPEPVAEVVVEPVVASAATEPEASPEPEPTATAPTPRVSASDEASTPRVRSHHWPSPHDLEVHETPVWRRPWLIATLVAVLFGIGWWLGRQEPRTPTSNASPIARMLSAVGLGGAHFALKVESDPPGAWIAIDGKDTGQRTPATFQLKPGLHRIRYSLTDLGSHSALVTGSNGQDRVLSETLHGNLEVRASNPTLPVRMSLDGQDQGFLPVSLTSLPPGLHQMQFSGPDLQPWAQTVNVPIRGTAHVAALPVITPATGVLQVQATLNDDAGAAPLKGATVFVDGELRGRTPLKLELARGPHSLRVTYDEERAPVQVIDLPGGNERFATFAFGIENDQPVLRLQGDVSRLSATRPVTVSAALDGMAVRDVREAHLHVKGADGLWRRLDMTPKADARGVVVSAPFPVTLLRGQSRTPWYVSVSSTQGDEFFTEIQRAGR